jgi:D-cysteine desulfhydrase family pyridoxal phosphate-dependent enzyme
VVHFPRFPILWGETPLLPLPRFAEAIGAKSIWIKRDDLTGFAFGGNKLRKLEFLIGEALKQGCDLIITGGSPQSNHARLTVAAANKAGLDTWLCFAGNRWGSVQGNLLLDHLLGAACFLTGAYGSDGLLQAMEEKAEDARRQGRKPYVIPVGGSTETGDYGYFLAWEELERQRKQQNLPPFDEIYLPVGTGGTLAGLACGRGCDAAGTHLVGISVWLPKEKAEQEVKRLGSKLMRKIGGEREYSLEPIRILDAYIGRKYGVPSDEGMEAIRLLAQTEGVFVDPVYTGKALAGLIDQVKNGIAGEKHLLFWHTGGTPALFTHASSLGGGKFS